jgi:hypothetical protein
MERLGALRRGFGLDSSTTFSLSNLSYCLGHDYLMLVIQKVWGALVLIPIHQAV